MSRAPFRVVYNCKDIDTGRDVVVKKVDLATGGASICTRVSHRSPCCCSVQLPAILPRSSLRPPHTHTYTTPTCIWLLISWIVFGACVSVLLNTLGLLTGSDMSLPDRLVTLFVHC